MASVMDRDPWDWSTQDVTDFFAHRHARQAMNEMPGVNLPPLDQLTSKLAEDGVTGAVLLLAVDDHFLQRRCKIPSLGPRAAVLHCINKLKAISPKYQSRNESTVWTAAAPPREPPQLDEDQMAKLVVKLLVPGGRLLQLLAEKLSLIPKPAQGQVQHVDDLMQLDEAHPSSTTTSAINQDDQPRPNEVLVEGKDGKKRRRLDLTTTSKEVPSDSQAFDGDDLQRSLPTRKMPIDDLFFGNTAMGRECGFLKIDHPLYVHEGSDEADFDEKTFQYVNFNQHLGVAGYVGSQLQRSMYTDDRKVIVRLDRNAAAIFPYRDGLQAQRTRDVPQYDRRGRIVFGGLRSAMVVQYRSAERRSGGVESDEDVYMAIRENEALIERNMDHNPAQTAELGNGEYDHLLLKYREDANDLMPETSPDAESVIDERDEDTNTELGDDQAEEDNGDEFITEIEAKEAIQEAVNVFIKHWQEVIRPRREVKKSWTIWKQTKRSKFLRDMLIQGARTRIQELEARLLQARTDLLRDPWDDKTSLQKVCQTLEPTVEDIQEEHWKIEVWNRRQEPDHISRKSTHKHTLSANGHGQLQTLGAMPRRPPNDRLSVSPRRRSPSSPARSEDNADKDSEAEGEHFHTPSGSPVPQFEDSPFIVPDNDDDMDLEQDAHAAAGAEADDVPEQSPNRPHSSHSAHSVPREMPVTPGGHEMLITSKTTTSGLRSHDAARAAMPSPSVLRATQIKKSQASPAASVVDLTDLQSNPFEPNTPPHLKSSAHKLKDAGRERKRKNNSMKDVKSEVPSTSEADSWTYAELMDNENRNGILIKLLRDMGGPARDSLWRTYQLITRKSFSAQLLAAADAITSPSRNSTPARDSPSQAVDSPKTRDLKRCARLFIAFYLARPDAYQEDGSIPHDIIAALTKAAFGKNDVEMFMQLFRSHMNERHKPLFSSPKPPSFDDPIVIDTDDEPLGRGGSDSDDSPHEGRGSARKRRRVKHDAVAESQQEAAINRMKAARESQQQQSSNPAMLQSMVPRDSEQGDKLVNVTRAADQEPIFINKTISKAMQSHQLDGVQFLWRELTANLDKAQGCLLAHTMGLGKTMQTIALLTCVDNASRSRSSNIRQQLPADLQLEESGNKRSLRFLVICPASLIRNWHREIQYWAPQHMIYSVTSSAATSNYLQQLQQWSRRGGVMLIGYPIFGRIVSKEDPEEEEADGEKTDVENVDGRKADGQDAADKKAAAAHRAKQDRMAARKILIQDAELVVADEAHHIKNMSTGAAIAASKIHSTARVSLSGTPMSNDVDEVYAIVSWVAPGYLGDKSNFSAKFGLPIKEGLYADSTRQEKRASIKKLKILHDRIEPKVHRADISVLKGSLKPKVEFVITVELTEQQCSTYAATVAALLGADEDLDGTALTRIFSWLAVLGHLTAHPQIFRRKLLTPRPPKKDAPKNDATQQNRRKSATAVMDLGANAGVQVVDDDLSAADSEVVPPALDSPEVPGDEDVFALGFTKRIVDALVNDLSEDIDPALSAKTRLLQAILRLSKQSGDNVLIFSSNLPTLDYLGDLLRREKVGYLRIDGSVSMEKRNSYLAQFQAGNIDAMLISTRAGGQGLNIQRANRVVIFDFGFNPTWEEQAIGRAYRLGQQKPVFVYRFVAGGTFESNIYNTQMFKTGLCKRVIDKKNPQRQAKRHTKDYLYEPKPVDHEDLSNELEINLDPHVMSKILQAQVDRGDKLDPSIDICNVRTMEVLQKDAADDPLDETELREVEENRAVWDQDDYMANLRRTSNFINHSAAPGGTAPTGYATQPSFNSTARTPSVLAASQVPAHPTPTAPQPGGQGQTRLPARDIRYGGTSSMAGLPLPRFDGNG